MMGLILFLVMGFITIGFPAKTFGEMNVQEILDMVDRLQRERDRQDKAIIRPLPQERTAIQELLEMSPPPTTLIPADRQFLEELGDKVAWTGLERRIMHMIYKEVHGKEINLPAPNK
jgi:hypothetical protein